MSGDLGRWLRDAGCRDREDLFFSEELAEQLVAKRLCRSCPVFAPCRRYIDEQERNIGRSMWFGIWAGEDPFDRAARRRANGFAQNTRI